MNTAKKASGRVALHPPAELSASRFIRSNSRTQSNPDGFSSGEQLLLLLLLRLCRVKGHTCVTNEGLAEMLGGKTAASVKSTMARLRRRGFVIQFQFGSQYSPAYRELVITPEKRKRILDTHGEPSEANNFWWFIVPARVDAPGHSAVSYTGSSPISRTGRDGQGFAPDDDGPSSSNS